jgi:hypothetical protein
MRPLAIDVRQFGQPEGIADNIRHSLTLGLPELQLGICRHDGTFVICGSGPSIEKHIEDIRKDQQDGKTICAVKGSYDFLRSHGITPDLYLSVEPRYKPVNDPAPNSVFLLASRCHPQMFKDLKSFRVYLWHSWSTEDQMELLRGRPCIGGGTTSGLRAVNVGYCLGFTKFKMYGMDSSLGTRGEKRVGQDRLGENVSTTTVRVEADGPEFVTNMAMAAQAQDFQSIYDVMPEITVDVIGTGLIPAIWNQRKARGLRC